MPRSKQPSTVLLPALAVASAVPGCCLLASCLLVCSLLASCALEPVRLDGRPCPCAAGYECNPEVNPPEGVCVAEGMLSGSGDGNANGDGDGDDNGDGDALGGGGDGDGDGDGGGAGPLPDGGTVGDATTCPPFAPPTSPCPPECDNCDNGICTFVCPLPASCMLTLVCPPGWPCVVDCAMLTAPGACNAGTLVCGDAPCELRCNVSTCTGYKVECGAGPCRAVCPANNARVNCNDSCLCTGACE